MTRVETNCRKTATPIYLNSDKRAILAKKTAQDSNSAPSRLKKTLRQAWEHFFGGLMINFRGFKGIQSIKVLEVSKLLYTISVWT